eukprot:UN02401
MVGQPIKTKQKTETQNNQTNQKQKPPLKHSNSFTHPTHSFLCLGFVQPCFIRPATDLSS